MDVPGKTFPPDVRHDYDGNPCSHQKAHNIYGMQMARATYHGVKRFNYPKRPFVITRSAYSGTQRYTSTWMGDNVASWEHLQIANIQAQRLALSGFSFAGSDIGGFAEQPNGELYARWIQLGTFHPFCRTHSSGDHGDQEPWAFDEDVTDVVRKFIEIRYQLLPYLYTAFYKYSHENDPIIKSLVLFDQEDPQTHFRTDEYIYGNQILVCPINEPHSKGRRMYIPRGEWYNLWTKELMVGGKETWVDSDLDEMPVFVKAGAIIPKYPIQQYVGEKTFDEVSLDVYYKDGKEDSELYEDSFDGYDYTKGRYSLMKFNLAGNGEKLVIRIHKRGQYITPYTNFKINLFGLPFEVKSIKVDNEKVALKDLKFKNNSLVVTKEFTNLQVIG
jgi:alpha-glucosidase